MSEAKTVTLSEAHAKMLAVSLAELMGWTKGIYTMLQSQGTVIEMPKRLAAVARFLEELEK